MKPEDAEEYTQALGQVVAGGWRQIALGERLGVPKALKLSTQDWVQQRLGGYVKYSIAERNEAVKALAEEGFSEREISRALGSHRNTVRKALGTKGTKHKQKLEEKRQALGTKRTTEAQPLDVLTGLAATNDIRQQIEIKATRAEREQGNRAALDRQIIVTTPGLIHGDFRIRYAELAPESVHLVLTDPPYDKDSIGLFGAAAVAAQHVLRPGGSLLIYAGQKYLGDVIAAMAPHLRYWWTFALVHQGSAQLLQKLGLRCGWKPILWFVKETRGDVAAIVPDILEGSGREKAVHEWQQGEAEAATLIERFTNPGDLVADFFAGSGTVLAAAKRLDRRFVGFEIQAANVEKIAERIA
jgi:16S rRNA G966 N2-methylase RsmD